MDIGAQLAYLPWCCLEKTLHVLPITTTKWRSTAERGEYERAGRKNININGETLFVSFENLTNDRRMKFDALI